MSDARETTDLTSFEKTVWAAWQSIPQMAFRKFDRTVDVDRVMAVLSAYDPWMTREQAQRALRGLRRKAYLESPEPGRFRRPR